VSERELDAVEIKIDPIYCPVSEMTTAYLNIFMRPGRFISVEYVERKTDVS
jgi:hypothetical protein